MPERTWTFSKQDRISARARKIAEIALADVVENELVATSLLPRATLRVQEVLEQYERLDADLAESAVARTT